MWEPASIEGIDTELPANACKVVCTYTAVALSLCTSGLISHIVSTDALHILYARRTRWEG